MTPYSEATRRLFIGLAVLPFAAVMSGCVALSVNSVPKTVTTPVPAHAFSGTVFGGQQPVNGSSIQVYTMNPTTLQGASTARLTPGAVTTNSIGGFSLMTTPYTCPSDDYVYIVATGGDAGSGANSNLAMMSGVGTCGSIGASTHVSINELTTVATAYALAPYMKDIADGGYVAVGSTGIANAFAMMNSMVNTATGTVPGATAPANATMPTTRMNTLADILAACVNTNTAGPGCTTLFGAALNNGTQPTNTIDAMLNIAHNPGANIHNLFSLVGTQSPYQQADSTQPHDLTLAVKLTGGSLATPYGVALDASGNAWVTNETGAAVSEFSPIGAALANAGVGYAFSGAQGISIDLSGNIWVANTGGNNVVKLTSSGNFSAASNSNTINAPVDIAADARGNIWVANYLQNPNNSAYEITELNNSAGFLNGLVGSVAAPAAIAVDPAGNVWISNKGSGYMTEYSKTATLVSTNPGYTDNALQGPAGVAFDASGNAWVAGQGGPELSGFGSAGVSLASAPVYNVGGASLAMPTGVAVDGGGTIWVSNSVTAGYLSQFAAGTGAPITTGQTLGMPLSSPVEIAIDPSGNLWAANSGDNSVTLFVGLAAPTLTPLVARTQ